MMATDAEQINEQASAARASVARTATEQASTEQAATVRIAAFDFDDTILEGHSPVRLCKDLFKQGMISYISAAKIIFWGVRYKLHLPVEQSTVRRYIFKAFKHVTAKEADRIMAEFYKEQLRDSLRPKALDVIRKHQSQGVLVAIVSASFQPIVAAAAADIGVDHFICTQMQVEQGSYTGHVASDPPEGAQKLIQLTRWANEAFVGQDWQLVAAYGDHRSDESILAAAAKAVAVNPDKGLERIAKKQGWQVENWSFTLN